MCQKQSADDAPCEPLVAKMVDVARCPCGSKAAVSSLNCADEEILVGGNADEDCVFELNIDTEMLVKQVNGLKRGKFGEVER